tara:strand:+ start:4680 stop:6095 length:1416 start_codon:yes stop_codon:yes gene_type:complete
MNYQQFISKDKSLLIAPAGFGKTHALAESISHTPEEKKQLILTHTHAGIASIKEKIKKFNIATTKYHIETITGFAQKYALAFYCGDDIPEQENSAKYYSFIIEKATELLEFEAVKRTVLYSYQGLFVDEYQDCSLIHHQMIMALTKILPTHILGDPMQGIFDFNETLVDFNNDLIGFEEVGSLNVPWRWNNANRSDLGKDLSEIRDRLKDGKTVELTKYRSIETVICKENEWYKPRSLYRNTLTELLGEQSLLLIHPISSSVEPRIKILKSFNNRLSLLESIDAKEFYIIAKIIDDWENKPVILLVRELSYRLFNKSGLDSWFNSTGFKRKQDPIDSRRIEDLKKLIIEIENQMKYSSLAILMQKIMGLPEVKCYRKDLMFALGRALAIADTDNENVYNAMVDYKNAVRRVGRKIYGNCIGTTLLTKGLEFDTVAILDAHRFDNYKHFYVAITRACKRLVIFSQLGTLDFH